MEYLLFGIIIWIRQRQSLPYQLCPTRSFSKSCANTFFTKPSDGPSKSTIPPSGQCSLDATPQFLLDSAGTAQAGRIQSRASFNSAGHHSNTPFLKYMQLNVTAAQRALPGTDLKSHPAPSLPFLLGWRRMYLLIVEGLRSPYPAGSDTGAPRAAGGGGGGGGAAACSRGPPPVSPLPAAATWGGEAAACPAASPPLARGAHRAGPAATLSAGPPPAAVTPRPALRGGGRTHPPAKRCSSVFSCGPPAMTRLQLPPARNRARARAPALPAAAGGGGRAVART